MDKDVQKQIILLVEDMSINIDIISGLLKKEYKIKVATNGEKALKIAFSEKKPDLILLDVMMPGMDGYEVCRQLKKDPASRNIPVIFITGKVGAEHEEKGFELGAVDYITKPISPPVVKARVKTHLALSNQNLELEMKVRQRTEQLRSTQFEIIRRLGLAGEFKDNETGLHVIRMSNYSMIIGIGLGMQSDEANLLLNTAPMHDIGKIGIPDSVLLKPGKLDKKEWEIMKLHPAYGAKIVGDHESPLLKLARTVALTHHEKWDGSGYPKGLKGEEIPLCGRVVAVADVFDALTTKRPYKDAWSIERSIDLIESEKGKHFDPEVVKSFMGNITEILKIKEKHAEKEYVIKPC